MCTQENGKQILFSCFHHHRYFIAYQQCFPITVMTRFMCVCTVRMQALLLLLLLAAPLETGNEPRAENESSTHNYQSIFCCALAATPPAEAPTVSASS